MIDILRTNSENEDFSELVKKLDLELAERDGEEHLFYDQFNKIDLLKYAVVAYSTDERIRIDKILTHRTNEFKN